MSFSGGTADEGDLPPALPQGGSYGREQNGAQGCRHPNLRRLSVSLSVAKDTLQTWLSQWCDMGRLSWIALVGPVSSLGA